MAKKRSKSKSSSKAVVVRASAPKPIIIRQSSGSAVARRRSSGRRRRSSGGGGSTLNALLSNERTGAMAGAAVLGLLDKQGTKLPTIPILGRAGTAGLVLWWLAKQQKSPSLNHAATGCLSIAVYELTKEGKVSGVDGFDDLNGGTV